MSQNSIDLEENNQRRKPFTEIQCLISIFSGSMDNYTLHSKMWIEKSCENNTGYLHKYRIFLQREFKLIVVHISLQKKNAMRIADSTFF